MALLEELRLTQEELHDIGDVIQAETAQTAQWLKLSEQNRLYDKIETVTARQLARIQEYLIALKATDDIDTARRLLKHIVILGTYIKRRSNLVFVCDKAEDIDTTELRLSLFESAESLRLSDIRCAVQIADTAKISPASAVAIYDAFEAIIEATCRDCRRSFSAPSIRRRAGGCAAAFNAPTRPLRCPACRRCSLNG